MTYGLTIYEKHTFSTLHSLVAKLDLVVTCIGIFKKYIHRNMN